MSKIRIIKYCIIITLLIIGFPILVLSLTQSNYGAAVIVSIFFLVPAMLIVKFWKIAKKPKVELQEQIPDIQNNTTKLEKIPIEPKIIDAYKAPKNQEVLKQSIIGFGVVVPLLIIGTIWTLYGIFGGWDTWWVGMICLFLSTIIGKVYWHPKKITQPVQEQPKSIADENKSEEPLHLLKLRFAKGEI